VAAFVQYSAKMHAILTLRQNPSISRRGGGRAMAMKSSDLVNLETYIWFITGFSPHGRLFYTGTVSLKKLQYTKWLLVVVYN